MKDVRTPEKPEAAKQDREYEFNLGIYRIETLSEILEFCAKKYKTAIRERTEEAVKEYQAMVNLLYTETYIYMEAETEYEIKGVQQNKDDLLEIILDDFNSLQGKEETMDRLKKVRSVYLEIRKLLQQVGIDIPEKETIGEMDTFAQG